MSGTVSNKAARARLRQVRDPAFWRALAPGMHLDAGQAVARWRPKALDVEPLVEHLYLDGYAVAADVITAPVRRKILTALDALIADGWPPPILFVYDELWQLPTRASHLLTSVLGEDYRLLPDFWAWRVDPTRGDEGWRPHRDKVYPTLEDDGRPRCLTLWAAVTDATPDNGCISVLPARFDRRYGRDHRSLTVEDPQEIRALPAKAGTLLTWTQAILHWGGRTNPSTTAPRVSFAFEAQRADVAPYNTPLLDPSRPPPFEMRLALIGKQILQYQHMYPLSEDLAWLAKAMLTGM